MSHSRQRSPIPAEKCPVVTVPPIISASIIFLKFSERPIRSMPPERLRFPLAHLRDSGTATHGV